MPTYAWSLRVRCETTVTYGRDLFGKRSGWGFDVSLEAIPTSVSSASSETAEQDELNELEVELSLVEATSGAPFRTLEADDSDAISDVDGMVWEGRRCSFKARIWALSQHYSGQLFLIRARLVTTSGAAASKPAVSGGAGIKSLSKPTSIRIPLPYGPTHTVAQLKFMLFERSRRAYVARGEAAPLGGEDEDGDGDGDEDEGEGGGGGEGGRGGGAGSARPIRAAARKKIGGKTGKKGGKKGGKKAASTTKAGKASGQKGNRSTMEEKRDIICADLATTFFDMMGGDPNLPPAHEDAKTKAASGATFVEWIHLIAPSGGVQPRYCSTQDKMLVMYKKPKDNPGRFFVEVPHEQGGNLAGTIYYIEPMMEKEEYQKVFQKAYARRIKEEDKEGAEGGEVRKRTPASGAKKEAKTRIKSEGGAAGGSGGSDRGSAGSGGSDRTGSDRGSVGSDPPGRRRRAGAARKIVKPKRKARQRSRADKPNSTQAGMGEQRSAFGAAPAASARVVASGASGSGASGSGWGEEWGGERGGERSVAWGGEWGGVAGGGGGGDGTYREVGPLDSAYSYNDTEEALVGGMLAMDDPSSMDFHSLSPSMFDAAFGGIGDGAGDGFGSAPLHAELPLDPGQQAGFVASLQQKVNAVSRRGRLGGSGWLCVCVCVCVCVSV